MRQIKTFKIISIVSYLLIILMGQVIGLPFFLWLLFTLFDFGNTDQFFAFLGVLGLTISCKTFSSTRTSRVLLFDIISFMLLASPIVRRLTAIPIGLFDYAAFIIPTLIFCLSYCVSLYYSVKQFLQMQKT